MPPGGQQTLCCHEVRLLRLAEHLLVELLVVLRHAGPLAQEGQGRPKEEFDILKKALPFGGTSVIFQGTGSRLYLLQAMPLQQGYQFAGYAIPGWGKEVPCLVECRQEKFSESREGWTGTHYPPTQVR